MNRINKKAKFNYNLFERFEAGVSLVGIEVRTIKTRGIDLSNSYVKILGGEAYLVNANIPLETKDSSTSRMRKLLLKRKEIIFLETTMKQKKLTLVPVRMYNRGRLIKLEIALAKPKRQFEKRELIKKKDVERDIEQELRGKDKI